MKNHKEHSWRYQQSNVVSDGIGSARFVDEGTYFVFFVRKT